MIAEGGKVAIPNGPGLGITLNAATLRKYAVS
jgi:L-alanine-DL-glutamate epimerase-like enolase superfamily enzyme